MSAAECRLGTCEGLSAELLGGLAAPQTPWEASLSWQPVPQPLVLSELDITFLCVLLAAVDVPKQALLSLLFF